MGGRIAKRSPTRTHWGWRTALVVAAVAFFVLGVSHAAYDITSPGWWTLHHLARKLYSLGAFAAIGYVLSELNLAESRQASPLLTGVAVGLYSAALEVAQRFAGSRETHVSNAIDVLFGFVGGLCGALAAVALSRLTGRKLPLDRPAEGLRDESGA